MNEYPSLDNIAKEDIPTPNTGTTTRAKFFNGLKLALAFILTGASVYIMLTAPSYWEKIKYQLYEKNNSGQIVLPTATADKEVVYLPDVQNQAPNTTPPQTSSQTPENQNVSLKDLENNYLIIPKINVKVPIVWDSPAEEETMLENLRSGVAHYNFTPLPDSGQGPVFITGHSSYYWWDKGLYKTIFTNLDQLENDDEIALAYNNIVYLYKVSDKIVVWPNQTEVLDKINEPILRLMTCVPIGTNLKRLVISAKQISPTKPLSKIEKTTTADDEIKKEVPIILEPFQNSDLLPWMP